MIESMTSMFYHFAAACQPGGGISFLKFPTWYKYLDSTRVANKCTVIFSFPDDFGKILLAVVEILLRVGALVAVGFVIYGGFQYITSQGEPDRASSARGTIINAIIGLVIAIIATTVVSFVAGNLTK